MLHVHLSNRYEVLSARLLTALARPVRSVAALMQPQTVLVPSLAVRRALTLDIARTSGVCTQVAFGFLAPWLWQQMRGAEAAPAQGERPLAAGPLAWRIWQVFGEAGFAAAHPRLAAQLRGDDPLMAYELAARTAELFEQYGTYRAEALSAWAAGQPWPGAAGHPDHAWQADLWQRLALPWQLPRLPPAAAADGAHAVHVFCPPAMPPLHLQWLQALAQQRSVHLYLLNPCREHWFDIVGARRLAQLQAQGQAAGAEVGNPLLAHWAQPTKALLQAVLATEAGSLAAEEAPYLPSPAATLLAELQNAVLELREPAAAVLAERAASGTDLSLQVHGCHSLPRQLEALQAHLLRLFAQAEAAGRPLAPGRVLVALPNLDETAPAIDAVFGAGLAGSEDARERSLPYLITGRAPSRSPGPARALLALLDLAGSRWRASEVWAVLQMPLVARRFGLLGQGASDDDAALQLAHELLQASGLRWGRDAEHRARLDLPAEPRQTWADALARLLLGHALPTPLANSADSAASATSADDAAADAASPVFAGILPAGAAEGAAALALGSLCAFAQALSELQEASQQPLLPAAWLPLLQALPGRFLQPAAGEAGAADDEALQALQAAIAALGEQWQQAELLTPLPLAVVRSALQQQLDAAAPGGLPGGAITFAAMASLRGLPYEHICVLGLDDGVWPGRSTPLEFDLMAAAPRAGDRQRRIDERNVFLDLLLAARSSLFLAYTARSQRDNAPLTPSVLLSELLDLLPPPARQRVLVEHPLQPFDARLFAPDADPRLRSPDAALAAALRTALAPGAGAQAPQARLPTAEDEDSEEEADDPRPPFFLGPLPPAAPAPGPRLLPLAQLRRFYRHPARALLQQRLGLRLLQAEEALQDDEPFLPDRSARRGLADELLPSLIRGQAGGPALAQALQRARASTAWPAGALGEATLQAEVEALVRYAGRVQAARAGAEQPVLAVAATLELDGAPCTLQAQLEGLRPQGLVLWRYARLGGPALLDAWLQHLMLCLGLQQAQAAGQPLDIEARTVWVAEDGEAEFTPVAEPAEALQALLDLYARGQRQPLHFYPRTSWEQARPGSTPAKVRNTWTGREGSTQAWAESRDPWNRLALRGVTDPLDLHFELQAQAVYQPLLEHLIDSNPAQEGVDDAA